MREIIAGIIYHLWGLGDVSRGIEFKVQSTSGLGTCVVEFCGENSYQMWRSEQLLVRTQTQAQSQWSISVVASDSVLVICPLVYIGDSLLSQTLVKIVF